jgi:molecular chaperone DnaK
MFSMGIDLGTTNTAAAVTTVSDGILQTAIIPLSEGKTGTSLKSSVSFDRSDAMFTGKEAELTGKEYPEGYASGFKVKMGTEYLYQANGKFHSPVELSAIILERVKIQAEKYMGSKLRDAVIAVPAYFSHNQRNATREAAAIAGIKVRQLVSEPTAAAIAYRAGIKSMKPKNILIFDMGSGTTDVSAVRAGGKSFKVLGTYGNTHLGGLDMDAAIEDGMKSFLRENGLYHYPEGLRNEAEKIKIKLSRHGSAVALLGREKIRYSMTSSMLREIIEGMMPEIYKCIDMALFNSGLKRAYIDSLILTGGPTKIPFLWNSIEEYLSIKAVKNINPETAVATGVSILASGYISGENGSLSKIKLQDVVPMTLGSVILNDIVVPMIPANTPVPCSSTRPFTTIRDYQREIEVKVVQGERPMGSDNIAIGNFRLSGIKPAPRGETSINVTYSVDKNGILTVSARDNDTGSAREIVIDNSMQHSSRQVIEMKEQVKKYFMLDSRRKKMAEIMNRSEQLLHELKGIANRQLSSETVYYNINTDILKLSKAIKGNNIKLLPQLIERFQREYSLQN